MVWSKNSNMKAKMIPRKTLAAIPTARLNIFLGRTGLSGRIASSIMRILLPENCPESSIFILCTKRRVSKLILFCTDDNCFFTEMTSGCTEVYLPSSSAFLFKREVSCSLRLFIKSLLTICGIEFKSSWSSSLLSVLSSALITSCPIKIRLLILSSTNVLTNVFVISVARLGS